MSYRKKIFFAGLAFIMLKSGVRAHDILVEFKGAYFLPTDSLFKDIYHNGGALYGPEITARLYKQLYGFASADFFNKKGASLGLYSPTKVNILPIAFGLKYLVPFRGGDFYIGLGALPTRVHVKNYAPYVTPEQIDWGWGGITKMGAYFNLPKSFFIDFFFDYSFVKISPRNCCLSGDNQAHFARLNSCSFGAGLGYRFN